MMCRLIEERDGKEFVDPNVHVSSSSCGVNFAQTNHQSSGKARIWNSKEYLVQWIWIQFTSLNSKEDFKQKLDRILGGLGSIGQVIFSKYFWAFLQAFGFWDFWIETILKFDSKIKSWKF
jgi:hypothetical protein